MKAIGEFCEQIRGVTYKGTESRNSEQDGYEPILRANNISSGKLLFDDLVYVPSECINKRQVLRKGDILIAASSGSLNIVGKAGYVERNIAFSFGAFCKLLRPNSKIESKYLFYFFCSERYRATISSIAIGANINNLRNEHISNLRIPVPSLQDQKQIVQILDTADTFLQKRKEQLNLFDDYLKSVFFEMFGDPVANQKKWEKKKLVKLCDIKGGGTPSKSNPAFFKGNIPWVSPKDMKQFFISDSIDKITEEAIEQSSAKLLPERCVLMVVRSGILKNKLPVAINRVPVAVNQDMKAFVVNDEINPEFLIHWFISQERNILQTVRGTTADNISSEVIKKLEIIVPDSKLQNKFASIVEQVEQTKQKMRASLDGMDNHFNALMQRYFG